MSRVSIGTLEDLADGAARRIDVEGHRIAIVRIGEAVHAIGDRCSHADYSLADGEVWSEDCMLECPRHGSRFSLLTGEPDTLPATTPVATYRVETDGEGFAVVFDDESGEDR